jgi:replicative DNA helicase
MNGELDAIRADAEHEIDPDFEKTVISAMVTSPGFVSQYRSVIASDLFRVPDNAFLSTTLLSFFDEYRQTPDLAVLVDLIRRSNYRSRGGLVDLVQKLTPPTSLDYVAKRIMEWARWQRIIQVVESDDRSDPRAFGLRVEEASRTGEHLSGGEIVMGAGIEHDETTLERPRIRTPWPTLNLKLDGGPELADLCIIESFINVGKTSLLVNIGTTALAQGELVCYGVFEDGEHKIRRRFNQCIAGMSRSELREWPEEARQRINGFFEQSGGKLYIKRLRSRRSTVDDFAGFVRSVSEREGRPCRVSISDYADRFAAPRRRSEDRQEYREIFEECKLMAGDLDLVHWTALQANRSSHNQDVVGLEYTGESIGKVEGADLVLGAGQSAEDLLLGFINLFTAKVRDNKKHEQLRLAADLERQRITEES